MAQIKMPDGTIIDISADSITKHWGSHCLGILTPDDVVNKFRELDSVKKTCYPEETAWVYQATQ